MHLSFLLPIIVVTNESIISNVKTSNTRLTTVGRSVEDNPRHRIPADNQRGRTIVGDDMIGRSISFPPRDSDGDGCSRFDLLSWDVAHLKGSQWCGWLRSFMGGNKLRGALLSMIVRKHFLFWRAEIYLGQCRSWGELLVAISKHLIARYCIVSCFPTTRLT